MCPMIRRIRFIPLVLDCGIDPRGDKFTDTLTRKVGD